MGNRGSEPDLDRTVTNGSDPARSLERAILQTVAYADIFDYPLRAPELHRYLHGQRASAGEVAALAAEGGPLARELSHVGPYITLAGREGVREIREARAREAARLWPEARRYGRQIAALPFVRMVAVTGALAVNNVEPGADIDYLIVTRPGHLWSCRALIVALVRYAARQGVTLCPNYLVSEASLEFSERSLYTARELSQMVPLAGYDIYTRLRAVNSWTQSYFPNAAGPPVAAPRREPRRFRGALLLEWSLHNPLGAGIERWEMRRKIRKFALLQPDHAEASFSADRCKGHFDAHARRVMGAYRQRTSALVPDSVKSPLQGETVSER